MEEGDTSKEWQFASARVW